MNLKKIDGSFNITVNGMPYNTIEGDKHFEETKELYETNPELFEIEVVKEETLEELQEKKINELKENRTAFKKTIQINSDYTYWDCDSENIKPENRVNFNFFNILNLIDFTQAEKDLFLSKSQNIKTQYDVKKGLIKDSTLETVEDCSTTFETEEV